MDWLKSESVGSDHNFLIRGLTHYNITEQDISVERKYVTLIAPWFTLPVRIGVIEPASPSLPAACASPFQACLVNQCTEINGCWNPSCIETSKNITRFHRKRHLFRNQLYVFFILQQFLLHCSKLHAAILTTGGVDSGEFFLSLVSVTVSWDNSFVLWKCPFVPRTCDLMDLARLVVIHAGFSSVALKAVAGFECILSLCRGELDWGCIWSTELRHSSFF